MTKLYQEIGLSIILLFLFFLCLLIVSELNQEIILSVLALASRFSEIFPKSPEQNIPLAILELKAK